MEVFNWTLKSPLRNINQLPLIFFFHLYESSPLYCIIFLQRKNRWQFSRNVAGVQMCHAVLTTNTLMPGKSLCSTSIKRVELFVKFHLRGSQPLRKSQDVKTVPYSFSGLFPCLFSQFQSQQLVTAATAGTAIPLFNEFNLFSFQH